MRQAIGWQVYVELKGTYPEALLVATLESLAYLDPHVRRIPDGLLLRFRVPAFDDEEARSIGLHLARTYLGRAQGFEPGLIEAGPVGSRE